tara:strand:+ start:435 stop:1970 length:1536 start_codon:yes stop_codon:yes gene_type:complete
MKNNNDIFWEFIKNCGKDCENINETRKIYKKKYGKEIIDIIDKEYDKYHNFFQTKIDPILNDSYDNDNHNYDNFFQHILSKGPHNFTKLLDNKYNKKIHTINMEDFDINYEVKETLFENKSEHQYIQVFDTKKIGRVLSIDNDFQFSEKDEHRYHEMISHVPINYFDYDVNILVIGGGDGGVAREALKHPNVKKVTLVELDQMIVDVTKKFFVNLAPVFDNPKLDLRITDGLKFVNEFNEPKFDIIILDLTDFGQSNPLHKISFYQKLISICNERHLICFNLDNFGMEDSIYDKLRLINNEFKYVQPYGVFIPTFGGGYYSFCLFSNTIDPKSNIDWSYFKNKNLDLKYYTPSIHISSFIFSNEIESKLDFLEDTQNDNLENKISKTISILKEETFSSKNSNIVHSRIDINNVDNVLLHNGQIINSIIDKFLETTSLEVTKSYSNDSNYIILNFLNGHLSVYVDFEIKQIYIDLFLFEFDNKVTLIKGVNNIINSLSEIDNTIDIKIKNMN